LREVVALRHVHFEDLGSLGQELRARGARIRYLDVGRDRLTDCLEQAPPDLLVVLGGPVGQYQCRDYPFLDEEMSVVRTRLGRSAPLLGICLGAQLIAAAMGARVYPAAQKEIGWGEVQLSPAGALSPLSGLTSPVLHWHGDTFDLPQGAVNLASTASCPQQAFAAGPHVLGLQFHAEVLAGSLEPWLIGHAHELAHSGVSIEAVRQGSERHAADLEVQSRRLFGRWLDAAST
jgi:GMP synthase (glutamine-hydrolysing)